MDPNFWHGKWARRQIGFHRSEVNPILLRHIDRLSLARGSRLFLPLCGKTLDVGGLRALGYRICGIEWVETAVQELFDELGATPQVTGTAAMRCYRSEGIDIFVGDIFTLSADVLGPVDAVYDRAALVALPADVRARYAAHLATITRQAPQLLVTYVYDQRQVDGPPFAVSADEVHQHYDHTHIISPLERVPVAGGMKGICQAREDVWLLEKRHPAAHRHPDERPR